MVGFICAGCAFWKPDPESPARPRALNGECRRHAPQFRHDDQADEDEAVWPPTSATSWCGEYRPDSLPLPFTPQSGA